MKSYYDMLGVAPSADAETIKKAFRREIARYHPDKVTHLGAEFQEMASTRAAELTIAYKTLTDPEARSEYDESLGQSPVAPHMPAPSREASYEEPASEPDAPAAEPHVTGHRFATERAGRDDIVRRAVLARVREVLKNVVGECDMGPRQGFDLACLSKAKPSLFRRTVPPSVLVRLAPLVDAPVAKAAWNDAVKLRVEQKPLILLLLGDQLAPGAELARAIEEQRRRHPKLHDAIFPVPVDIRDWTAKVPANAPDSVKALIEKLRNYAG